MKINEKSIYIYIDPYKAIEFPKSSKIFKTQRCGYTPTHPEAVSPNLWPQSDLPEACPNGTAALQLPLGEKLFRKRGQCSSASVMHSLAPSWSAHPSGLGLVQLCFLASSPHRSCVWPLNPQHLTPHDSRPLLSKYYDEKECWVAGSS